MSEKYTYRGSTVCEGGEELSTIDIVDCLNELNDENQELKRLIKKMGELGGFNKHLIKTICEDFGMTENKDCGTCKHYEE